MTLIEPKNEAEYEAAFANSTHALVYLTATWCGPCRAIAPEFKKQAEAEPTIDFFKVDVDLCGKLDVCQNVSGVPTFIAIKNKSRVASHTGASKDNIAKCIAALK